MMSGEALDPPVGSVGREVTAIVKRTAGDAYRVFLFDSWASGDAHERSAIDIGIDGPARVDPAAMFEIRDACERLPTLYHVDVVDLTLVTPDCWASALSCARELGPV